MQFQDECGNITDIVLKNTSYGRLTGEYRFFGQEGDRLNSQKGKKVRKHRGFTLIELLVVIAIIALLLSIMVPSLQMAKGKGEQIRCASNLRSIGIGVFAYLTDNDDTYHVGRNNGMWRDWVTGSGDNDLEFNDPYAYWGIAYAQYTDRHKMFECPSARVGYVDCWLLPGEPYNGVPIEQVKDYFKYCAYGLNTYMNWDWSGGVELKAGSLKSQSTIIFAQDHIEQLLDSTNSDMFCIGPSVSINLTQWRFYQNAAEGGAYSPNSAAYLDPLKKCFRHGRRNSSPDRGYSNTLWVDGHVSRIAQTDGADVPIKWYNHNN